MSFALQRVCAFANRSVYASPRSLRTSCPLLHTRPFCAPCFHHPSGPRAMTTTSKTELETFPGVTTTKDPATKDYIFQQTMYRIKDPKRSLDFYTRIIGMNLLTKLDFEEMKFSLYFLGFEDIANIPEEPADRTEWMFARPATLELTHNWGTESDDSFPGYHSGNADPKGYGHIGLAVPDVDAACARFEAEGVEFVKRPNDGKMKGIAFIKDPDGYWIEIFSPRETRKFVK
ncbi:hypothetical protein WJX72_007453 [[Myrmecia] bisecta]|uniref:Lactoylglutathione lyase n=1 Tax=[Myrmecia] bisecta TaxID=41462 RepID=A0AAW1QRI0_9CHLO